MRISQNLLSAKRRYLYALMLLPLIAVVCVAFSFTGPDDFDIARREVLLRKVGHQLLLQAGDSTSRVLPVKKTAENEYQITFENDFSFQPDSLVNTVKQVLAQDSRASDYVVNVINCGDASVAYGYAFAKNKKDDIVTCNGRKQPAGCYKVDIKFKPGGINIKNGDYLLSGLSVLAFVGLIFFRSGKPRKRLTNEEYTDVFKLGGILFDAKSKTLTLNGTTIELTGTETRVLRIFALSPNETIARSRLQKEIWEDEGVIVGRSLDMFISKLRKKLEVDPNINIVVIRGKGYRLEISG